MTSSIAFFILIISILIIELINSVLHVIIINLIILLVIIIIINILINILSSHCFTPGRVPVHLLKRVQHLLGELWSFLSQIILLLCLILVPPLHLQSLLVLLAIL